jgi:hypothetical protein
MLKLIHGSPNMWDTYVFFTDQSHTDPLSELGENCNARFPILFNPGTNVIILKYFRQSIWQKTCPLLFKIGTASFWAQFFHGKSYLSINFDKKMDWATFWAIFHKPIWSP